ncbi:MAG: GNAT family acetyltransferase [Lachnospiraceae bacterium]|nr:GNAT family acetyltransferase [Lachnospiraceae bacterium]
MEQSYISLKGQISLDFLKKRNFTGSYKEMRYNLFIKDGQLTAAIYPQPYCWECTPEEQKTYQSFETSKDGLEEAIAWLNEAYETAAWRSETDE